MYCPRCNITTEDKFCENCGGETIGTMEAPKQTECKESFNKENFKMNLPKLSKKKIITLVAGALLLAIGIGGYVLFKGKNTPKNIVEKYFNYLAEGNYSSAYKMLSGTDDKFLSEDLFKKSMEQTDFNNFKIEEFSPEEYRMVYFDPSNSSNFDITNASDVFTVDAGSKSYPVNIIKDGKKLLFFDDYKLDINSFTTKWSISTPNGATVNIEGIEPNKCKEGIDTVVTLKDNYTPTKDEYELSIFNGNFNVTSEMPGAKKVTLNSVQAGKDLDIEFNLTDELTNELQEKAKSYLELYYANAPKEKYSKLMTKNNEAINKIQTTASEKVTYSIKEIKVSKQNFADSGHAIITITGLVDYEDNSLVEFEFPKQVGTKDILSTFYFLKQDDKWLILDTSYIY